MRKGYLIVVVLWLLAAGCKGAPENSADSWDDHTSTPTAAGEVRVPPVEAVHNPFSVWDSVAAQYGGGSFMVQFVEDPDLFNLYLEGLHYPSPYVQWYSSNKLIAYTAHPDKQKAVDALTKLAQSEDENVRRASKFTLEIFQRNITEERLDKPPYVKAPNGLRGAFHLFQEAQYNDGTVWIYELDGQSVYPLEHNWLNICDLKWSPDSTKLAVEFCGREWRDVELVDIAGGGRVIQLSIRETLSTRGLYQVKKQPRPDPVYRLVEWHPDSSKAMFSYSYTDDHSTLRQGIMVYDLNRELFTQVLSFPEDGIPSDPIKIPEGFSWE